MHAPIDNWTLAINIVFCAKVVRWVGMLTRQDQDFLPSRCNLQEKSGSLHVKESRQDRFWLVKITTEWRKSINYMRNDTIPGFIFVHFFCEFFKDYNVSLFKWLVFCIDMSTRATDRYCDLLWQS